MSPDKHGLVHLLRRVHADNSVYCSMPSCIPAASLMSKMCVAAEASTSSIAVGSPSKPASTQNPVSPNYSYTRGTVRRFTWVFTWKNLTLDGYEKPVSSNSPLALTHSWQLTACLTELGSVCGGQVQCVLQCDFATVSAAMCRSLSSMASPSPHLK